MYKDCNNIIEKNITSTFLILRYVLYYVKTILYNIQSDDNTNLREHICDILLLWNIGEIHLNWNYV